MGRFKYQSALATLMLMAVALSGMHTTAQTRTGQGRSGTTTRSADPLSTPTPSSEAPTPTITTTTTTTAAATVLRPDAPEALSTPAPATSSTSPVAPQADDDRLPFMADANREADDGAPSAFGLLTRTLGALLLIVGLIVAAAFGMKRFGGARFGAPRADAPELAVLVSVALGDRRSLAVVRFGEQTLLVGSTQQAITLLASTDEGAASDFKPLSTPVARSVGEMLTAGGAGIFDEELSRAVTRSGTMPGVWHETGEEEKHQA